jgi:hypothetical protein
MLPCRDCFLEQSTVHGTMLNFVVFHEPTVSFLYGQIKPYDESSTKFINPLLCYRSLQKCTDPPLLWDL